MTSDESRGVKWQRLFNLQLFAVVHAGHRLADRKLIGFEELAGEPFVVLNRDQTIRKIFDDACVRHAMTPTIAFEGAAVPTLRGLIGARLGVGVLPPSTTPNSEIVEIAIDDEELTRPIAIGWMTHRYLPPSAAAFRATAIASYGLPEKHFQRPDTETQMKHESATHLHDWTAEPHDELAKH
jgi:LysR family transcriptional activator of glutamate synthase operon